MSHPKVSPHRAFTLVELLVVVVVVAVFLVGLLSSGPSNAKNKSKRIQCVINLKQMGLAAREAAADNGDLASMDRSVTNGALREAISNPAELWRFWAGLATNLTTPKVLVCPSDQVRVAAATFAPASNVPTQFVFRGNHQLSYFLGLLASEERPQSILAGDRNLTTNGVALQPGRHDLAASTKLGWTETIHRSSGNVLLGDGSVQQTTSGRLNDQLQDAQRFTGATNDIWLIP